MDKKTARFLLATSLFALAAAASRASETTTYTYDELGRLTATSSSGTVNNGVATSIAYDPAGNRSSYAVTGAGGGNPPPPPPPPPSSPPPPPPPSNNPPTPLNDSGGTQGKCTTSVHNVTANDSDPDGDYPLTVISVTGTGFSVYSGSQVQFSSNSSTGTKTGTYTVQDSRGATATATLSVSVSGGSCTL